MGISDSLITFILSQFNLTYLQTHAYTIAFDYFFTAVTLIFIVHTVQYIIRKYERITENNLTFELGYLCSQVQREGVFVPFVPSRRSKTYNTPQNYYFFDSNERRIINIFALFLYTIALLIGGLAPAILNGADIISVWVAILILIVYFGFGFLFLTVKNQDHKTHTLTTSTINDVFQSVYTFRRPHPHLAMVYGIFCLLYIIIVPLSLSGLCLAYYNPKAGFEYGSFWASTKMTRYFYQPTPCPKGQVCHIYSTLPEDPSTSVFVNVHTGTDMNAIDIRYRKIDKNFTKDFLDIENAQSYYLDIEDKAARYVHTAYLTNLQPATEYYIQICHDNSIKSEAYFKTLPNENMNNNITIALGGDVGGSSTAEAIVNQLGTYDPDVIMLGGDLAYDNGNPYCYYTYDVFLNMFEGLNKRLNKLVPLVLALGNHDIGYREYQFLPVDKEKNLFFFYFPQHSRSNIDEEIVQEVPSPNEREAYFYHKIGNTLHVTLDSGYINKYDGEQLEWLVKISQVHYRLPKYAIYHVPIVPACYFGMMKLDERAYLWAPVFESLKFLGAFENHMHLYKRTVPIKFNRETRHGVIYFGDGNWGVNAESCYDEDDNKNRTGLFASLGKLSHVWIMILGSQEVQYFAIDSEGERFDGTLVQSLNNLRIKKINNTLISDMKPSSHNDSSLSHWSNESKNIEVPEKRNNSFTQNDQFVRNQAPSQWSLNSSSFQPNSTLPKDNHYQNSGSLYVPSADSPSLNVSDTGLDVERWLEELASEYGTEIVKLALNMLAVKENNRKEFEMLTDRNEITRKEFTPQFKGHHQEMYNFNNNFTEHIKYRHFINPKINLDAIAQINGQFKNSNIPIFDIESLEVSKIDR